MTANNYLIVVGVDGSEGPRKALQWAVREAHHRGGQVQAVTAWRWDDPQLAGDTTGDAQRKRAEAMLAHEVESLPLFQLSGVPVACEVIEGRPGEVLVSAARHANLLVLGSHGRSRALLQLLGSVSEECVRNATCPVVVLPTRFEGDRDNAAGTQLAGAR